MILCFWTCSNISLTSSIYIFLKSSATEKNDVQQSALSSVFHFNNRQLTFNPIDLFTQPY